MVNKLIFASLAIALVIVATVVQGRWTDRWSTEPAEKIQHFAEAFDEMPMLIVADKSEWRGLEPKEDAKKKARTEERAGADKIRTIQYQDISAGEVITVMMVCGPSRDVSNHTPDACYVSQGYKMTEPIRKFKIGDGVYYTSIFQKGASDLRIFWSWNPEGDFEVPPGQPPVDPRKVYGGRKPLNKIYLIHQVTPETRKPEDSPCVAFGREFMKQFNEVVFPVEVASDSKDKNS